MASAADKLSWGEICKKVSFQDGLYRDCRKNDPSYTGFENSFFDASAFEGEDDGYDEADDALPLGRRLAKHALPIPKAPPKDWVYEPEGVLEQIMAGSLGKYLIYGSAAAVLAGIWYFWLRPAGAGQSGAYPTPALTAAASAPTSQAA